MPDRVGEAQCCSATGKVGRKSVVRADGARDLEVEVSKLRALTALALREAAAAAGAGRVGEAKSGLESMMASLAASRSKKNGNAITLGLVEDVEMVLQGLTSSPGRSLTSAAVKCTFNARLWCLP